jgi:hypothetical protein
LHESTNGHQILLICQGSSSATKALDTEGEKARIGFVGIGFDLEKQQVV